MLCSIATLDGPGKYTSFLPPAGAVTHSPSSKLSLTKLKRSEGAKMAMDKYLADLPQRKEEEEETRRYQ